MGAAMVIVGLFAAVQLFGTFTSIRTQGHDVADRRLLLAYVGFPLLNLEAQCAAAGLGPYEFRLFGPLRQLVPYKALDSVSWVKIQEPPRVERSSPAGMLEYLQWCYGPIGVAAFALLFGWLAKTAFNRALENDGWLILYSYTSVAIAVAQSNNQMLLATYVPGPLVVVLPLVWLARGRRGGHSRYARAEDLGWKSRPEECGCQEDVATEGCREIDVS
jgi:hypothetical protein